MVREETIGRRCPVHVLIAVTSPLLWKFYAGTVAMLREAGFEPVLVSAPGEELQLLGRACTARYEAVPMAREIAPAQDVASLWRLYRFIRRVRPVIIDVGSPKAALLAGLAAWLLHVPCRVYTLHGLRLETATGPKRWLLTQTERVACACAHRVICVSPSLRKRAIELGLTSPEKAVVLGNGSCGGIDVDRFSPGVRDLARRQGLAGSLDIPADAPVLGFVGRLTRDKGLKELTEAYARLRQIWPELRLLLVGDFEGGDPVEASVQKQIATDPHVTHTGFVADTAPYYGLMDVLALPTHREGLGMTALEAQACGIPVVTTTATGAVDSVVNGVTGFHVPAGDSEALEGRIDELLSDAKLRSRMGQAGRERVVREFRHEAVEQALLEEYQRLLRVKAGFHAQPSRPKLVLRS